MDTTAGEGFPFENISCEISACARVVAVRMKLGRAHDFCNSLIKVLFGRAGCSAILHSIERVFPVFVLAACEATRNSGSNYRVRLP